MKKHIHLLALAIVVSIASYSQDSINYDAEIAKGDDKMDSAQYDKAISHYQLALIKYKNNPYLLYSIGFCFMVEKEYYNTISAFTELMKYAPKNKNKWIKNINGRNTNQKWSDVYFCIGSAKYGLEDYLGGIKYMDSALICLGVDTINPKPKEEDQYKVSGYFLYKGMSRYELGDY